MILHECTLFLCVVELYERTHCHLRQQLTYKFCGSLVRYREFKYPQTSSQLQAL